MTSKPLLTSVAELIVMTGPMAQVGWSRACPGVTVSSSARLLPRKGPPLAVTMSRRTSSVRPPRRHWARALCSLSTGTIWPGPAAALTSGPPTIRDSLLARARVLPASSAARVGRSPIEPVIPLRTTSAPLAARSVLASGPDADVRCEPVTPSLTRHLVDRRRDDVVLSTGHPDRFDAERDRLPGQQVEVAAAGADRAHLEALRTGRDDLESLGADGTGGTQDDNAAR